MEGGFGVMSPLATGCGSVWLERSVRDAEAARSNRAIPTIKKQTGSSEAGARFLFPKSGMCSLLCGACACDAGGRRCLASKRHSCRPAYAVCGSGCRGDPRGGLRGRYFHRSPLRFLPGIFAVLACCAAPCPVAASAGKGIALHLLPYRKPEGRQRLSHKK